MLDEVIDEALVYAGRVKGWRPEGAEIAFGYDVAERAHAADVLAPALYARFVEKAVAVGSGSIVSADVSRDRSDLERLVLQVVRASVRLVVLAADGSVVEFQEWWRGPLMRFERAAEKPTCVEQSHRFDLDLAYRPDRYNTQQRIVTREAIGAHLQARLGIATELVEALRRGGSVEEFDFAARGFPHLSGLDRWSEALYWALDVFGFDEVGGIDRCLNGCGIAAVRHEQISSLFFWPAAVRS